MEEARIREAAFLPTSKQPLDFLMVEEQYFKLSLIVF